MTDQSLTDLRRCIARSKYADETETLADLIETARLSPQDRARIGVSAADLVREIRKSSDPGLMEVFLAEYGLSTDEGVALMCLAEALLRVPDAETIDALIEDKIAPSNWGQHLGHSSSSLVNASTWALMLTGRVLDDDQPGIAGALRGAVKRLGEPLIRTAVARAMREMGRQFVLGETIENAMKRAQEMERKGFTYSYDMLGEAARAQDDADRYFDAYSQAISAISKRCTSDDPRLNPGISIKLSALHPRYEELQRDRVLQELTPRVLDLAMQAKAGGMGLNIDAEEADRLDLSLDIIEKIVSDEQLAGWDGFGVVVQAYGQRAGAVIEYLYGLAQKLDRRFMVRLVKGAYWDTEIKHAQVLGIDGFPVFTRKAATDVSYIANARRLLRMSDWLYPQFATHNAHTAAAILDMGADPAAYEFQKLHGMGDRLHELVMAKAGTRCRIYAPVGAHRDLLAYLVRRLLENGANSSFVNQIVDEEVSPEMVAADPFDALNTPNPLRTAPEMFQPERKNSRGWDFGHRPALDALNAARAEFAVTTETATPLIAGQTYKQTKTEPRYNPALPDQVIGHASPASAQDIETALKTARPWPATVAKRADILNKAADLYEENAAQFFAILAREAGKTIIDAIGELREAVDFLRYYAARAQIFDHPARGVFACISPWNFPLAIFTGQIAGALAVGNAVIAKPAEQTPLISHMAITLLHKAGVPREVLQLLPGDGATVGAALTSDPRISGVAFTGSTDTALRIRRAMADHLTPGVPLIAETGGLNAMIVDSTALPEQAVRDIVQSAFQSAGQRCSALRCLYVQEEIADSLQTMLSGAMDALSTGDPWSHATDIGPVIDLEARDQIAAYIATARQNGQIVKELMTPQTGTFIAPTVIRINGIQDMHREIFGPVLHIATFKADEIDDVVAQIAGSGYGLTFGLHTRIDDRVQHIVERLPVGNIYVNRNQIGAIVGSQPFGGEGLSGTGPKAGGPDYLTRFAGSGAVTFKGVPSGSIDARALQTRIEQAESPRAVIDAINLPGPTGESNRLTRAARLPILCLGPGKEAMQRQIMAVTGMGGVGVPILEAVDPEMLTGVTGIGGVVWWGDQDHAKRYNQALARRDGEILPLIVGTISTTDVTLERHLCIDTTAAGGNAELLADVSG